MSHKQQKDPSLSLKVEVAIVRASLSSWVQMLRAKPSRAVRHGGKGSIDVGSVRAVRGAGGRAGCA